MNTHEREEIREEHPLYDHNKMITLSITIAVVVAIVIIVTSIIIGHNEEINGIDDSNLVFYATSENTIPETIIEETVTQEKTAPCTEPTVVETTAPSTEPIHTYERSVEYEGVIYNVGTPENDVERLACVIYQEQGGDASCDDCRRRVGDIVLNRVADDRFPDTIEGVLLQKSQYGEFGWTGIKWKDRATNSGEAHAVARAYRIAQEILDGNHSDVYGEYIWQAGFHQGTDEIYHCGTYYGK